MDNGIELAAEQPPEKTTRQVWNWIDVVFISILAGIIFAAGLYGINLWLGSSAREEAAQPSALLSAVLGALEGIALIGGVYLVGLRRNGYGWWAAGLRPMSTGWFIASTIIGGIVIPASGLIAYAIQLALGRSPENPQIPFLAPEGFTWFSAISMFVLGGLLAPFAEELFFRGVFYRWLRDRWGVWPGILISGLVFGALHGEISIAGAAAVLGFLLAWVYERSGSLWPAVLIHVINNSFKIILLFIWLATGSLTSGGV